MAGEARRSLYATEPRRPAAGGVRYRARAANLRENAKRTSPVTSALQVGAAKRDQFLADLLYPMNLELAKEFPDG